MERISIEESLNLLRWAEKLNQGKWVQHSMNVGRAAYAIAKRCNMDSELAYCMGLLHDIGRYEGINDMRHLVEGYRLMAEKNYDAIARICMTHSFPVPNIESFSGKNDCKGQDYEFIKSYLEKIEYDDYDKLIQLCDVLGDANGITLMEIRLVDVARRRGVNDLTIEKWNTFFDLKEYFDKKCGGTVYSLFYDEICNNLKF